MLDETGEEPAELRAAVTSPAAPRPPPCGRSSSRRCAPRTSRRWPPPSSGRASSAAEPRPPPAAAPVADAATGRRPTILPCRATRRPRNRCPRRAGNGAPAAASPRPPWPGSPSTSGSSRSCSGRARPPCPPSCWVPPPRSTRPRCARTCRCSGSFGTRGAGYDVAFLVEQIDRQLGLDREWTVVIAGDRQPRAGPWPAARGSPPATSTVVGPDRHRPGHHRGADRRRGVRHPDDLPDVAAGSPLAIGVITTPAPVAQRVADLLVDGRGAVAPQLRPPGAGSARRTSSSATSTCAWSSRS